jgi:hypothetical protein
LASVVDPDNRVVALSRLSASDRGDWLTDWTSPSSPSAVIILTSSGMVSFRFVKLQGLEPLPLLTKAGAVFDLNGGATQPRHSGRNDQRRHAHDRLPRRLTTSRPSTPSAPKSSPNRQTSDEKSSSVDFFPELPKELSNLIRK